MTEEPHNLRSVYAAAENLRRGIESSFDTNAPAYQAQVTAAIKAYEQCLKIAGHISLFSPNESIEDISSHDIQ